MLRINIVWVPAPSQRGSCWVLSSERAGTQTRINIIHYAKRGVVAEISRARLHNILLPQPQTAFYAYAFHFVVSPSRKPDLRFDPFTDIHFLGVFVLKKTI